jgi:hypothetical protein
MSETNIWTLLCMKAFHVDMLPLRSSNWSCQSSTGCSSFERRLASTQ